MAGLVSIAVLTAWVSALLVTHARRRAIASKKSDQSPITFAEADRKAIETPIISTLSTGRVLVGARPDASTTLRLAAPAEGWATKFGDLSIGQVHEILGRAMEIATRGPPAEGEGGLGDSQDDDESEGAIELRARGQARLLVWPDRAELVIGSRALDTLGGIRGWASVWLTWATEALLGRCLDRERVLESADEAGWSPTKVDLCAELGGWGPLMSEHQDPDRWTQQTTPLPVPDTQGRLSSLRLGSKASPMSIYGYDKTGWAERTGRGAAWLERMRQAGLGAAERAWRWELRLRDDALRMRVRGSKSSVVVDFTRCTALADQEAIARVWAHAFGNAEAERPSGHWRLVVPAHRFDAEGRGLPPTRVRALDPLWRLVQSAGGKAPIETLALLRERRAAARADWRGKAEETAIRGLASLVALDHDGSTAAEAALGEATRLVALPRWQDEVARQRSASADLRDEEAQA